MNNDWRPEDSWIRVVLIVLFYLLLFYVVFVILGLSQE